MGGSSLGADALRVKGVVFNMLERVVSAEYGDATWDVLLADAQIDGAYTSLGNYPDEELIGLVAAASARLELPADDIVRWFGRGSMPLFHENYPELFAQHDGAREFILTINNIVHPQVRKLYPGAKVPEFGFVETEEPDALCMTYQSGRQLCSFAEGLIEGAATHYGETAAVEQSTCMKRGDAHCTIDMRFARA